MKIYNYFYLIIILLITNSCGIGYLKTYGLTNTQDKTNINTSCNFTFNISFSYLGYLKESRKKSYENEDKQNIDAALKEIGCIVKYDSKNNSDIIINIENQPFLGASGVDYLSAFSFGIIPTWGKSLELKVTLENKIVERKKHTKFIIKHIII